MNNKGFAITGILYTLFILFVLIVIAILANISFKRGALSKSIADMESSFSLIKVETLTDGYKVKDGKYYANYDGKYSFELNYKLTTDGPLQTIKCSTYIKKNALIPLENVPSANENNPAKDFILTPTACNDYYYQTSFDSTETGVEQKMILKEIYKFKDSD